MACASQRNFAKGAAASAPKQLAHALPLIARGFRLGRQEDAHELCRRGGTADAPNGRRAPRPEARTS
eukprot:6172236-Pleurochrysis_carterae.AAC.2